MLFSYVPDIVDYMHDRFFSRPKTNLRDFSAINVIILLTIITLSIKKKQTPCTGITKFYLHKNVIFTARTIDHGVTKTFAANKK